MEITWDRIQALSARFIKSKDLEVERFFNTYMVKNAEGWHHVQAYPAMRSPWCLTCDCQDFLFNSHLNGGFCKHLMAVLKYRETEHLAAVSEGWPPEAGRDHLPLSYDPELERKIKELY